MVHLGEALLASDRGASFTGVAGFATELARPGALLASSAVSCAGRALGPAALSPDCDRCGRLVGSAARRQGRRRSTRSADVWAARLLQQT